MMKTELRQRNEEWFQFGAKKRKEAAEHVGYEYVDKWMIPRAVYAFLK